MHTRDCARSETSETRGVKEEILYGSCKDLVFDASLQINGCEWRQWPFLGNLNARVSFFFEFWSTK